MSELAERARTAHSLWHNNPVLVHLFGLTPLLALATTVVLGTTMLAIMGILLFTGSAISSLTLNRINANWHFLYNLALLAVLTTVISALLTTWNPPLRQALGIYLPLLSCSLLPLLHLQSNEAQVGFGQRLIPLLKLLAGYGLAVILLAALREGLTYGRLLTDLGLLAPGLETGSATGLLPIAATPAGGLILLSLLAAAATWLRQQFTPTPINTDVEPALRARVTEKLQ